MLFLSKRNSCRSQMAEAILRNYDDKLNIFSAGLDPVDHVSPIAIEVMAEVRINLEQSVPHSYTDYKDMDFDYLITVGEGTNEELNIHNVHFKKKLHLGFRSPYKGAKSPEEIRDRCREVRDELLLEMDYFYRRILKNKASTN
ncbi:hypothetical protein SLH46_10690 [Draconibacterium sp. IB214405]|uniref:arsenate reductase/protein-tyrosine-phosphatase family protein n=1 Tax=Draconibacterium sp. IB214405 TaxID=3097352 RepID=UPI002A133335|nr:hypothetical protein [Draconibacterium sp. IB214405]MDX8339652.1 hypothetical protein [Draconibacterium sp. IB214405]